MEFNEEYPQEPFKIHCIKDVEVLSREERLEELEKAHYNLFNISSRKVSVDVLTDSGTGALSARQWAQIILADESYAKPESWERLEPSVKHFSGKDIVIPVHQGRAAEKIIAEAFLKSGDIVLSNSHFDTTRANFEHRGATCSDIPSKKSVPLHEPQLFKGDIDLEELEQYLISGDSERIKIVLMTLTNNTGGGQPASFENVKEASWLAKKYGKLFVIDACRIAENGCFIWWDEVARQGSIEHIIRTLFSFADIAYMSAKKDGLSNTGGFIVTDDEALAIPMLELLMIYEGCFNYGGMSGRDMESVAQGLKEVVSPDYLYYRIGQVAYLHRELAKGDIPLVHPCGGHAVYVDAAKLLPHIPKEEFPAQAFAIELYKEGGVRSTEIGSLMFGIAARAELLRLAIPRRVYLKSSMDHIVHTFEHVIEYKERIHGYKITWQPRRLRHFWCKLEPVN